MFRQRREQQKERQPSEAGKWPAGAKRASPSDGAFLPHLPAPENALPGLRPGDELGAAAAQTARCPRDSVFSASSGMDPEMP